MMGVEDLMLMNVSDRIQSSMGNNIRFNANTYEMYPEITPHQV